MYACMHVFTTFMVVFFLTVEFTVPAVCYGIIYVAFVQSVPLQVLSGQ